MCLKCHILNLSINLDGLEPEFKRVAKLIYAGKLAPGEIDPAMVGKMADQLLKSFYENYGASAPITPSFAEHIKQNIFVFSGFKNYQQLKEASMLLLDDNGGYKSFNSWFQDIKQINDTYNETYAKAEHANTIASAQAISSWNDFNEFGVTRLRFETAGDSRVRDEHRLLNGTVVDIDDPMLDKYYTPLDWGCRCEWVPAVDEDLTGWGDLPKVPPMFQTNVAKTGVIFPDTHPYFDVPKVTAEKITKQVFKIMETVKDESRFVPKAMANYKKELGVEVNDEIFDFLNADVPLTSKGKGAYYSPSDKIVNIPIDSRRRRSDWCAESIVYHEYGHAIDWQHGFRQMPEVKALMDKYRKQYRSQFKDLSTNIYDRSYKAHFAGDHDLSEKLGAAADTIMSLNANYGFGHTKAYFKGAYKSEAEFIAHAFENKFAGNEIFKELMPDLFDDMINLIDNVFKPKSNLK